MTDFICPNCGSLDELDHHGRCPKCSAEPVARVYLPQPEPEPTGIEKVFGQ